MNYLNNLIATGSMDATVKIWDIKGDIKFTLEGPSDDIRVI